MKYTKHDLIKDICFFFCNEYGYDEEAEEKVWEECYTTKKIGLLYTEIYEDDVKQLWGYDEEMTKCCRDLQVTYNFDTQRVEVYYDDVLKHSIHFSYRELIDWLDWDSLYALKDGLPTIFNAPLP